MGAKLFIQKFSFLEKDRKKEKMSRLTSLGFEPELSLDFSSLSLVSIHL